LKDLQQLELKLSSLVVFRGLLGDPVIEKLSRLLASAGEKTQRQVEAYAGFVSELFQHTQNWTGYLQRLILEDENLYLRARAARQPVGSLIEECVENELAGLQELTLLTSADVRSVIHYDGYLPAWETAAVDLRAAYRRRMEILGTAGFGMFAEHSMFSAEGGQLIPVRLPDPIRLSDLKGYEAQRAAVVGNTLALLEGKPAANVLLYGDAGTGKSSTVKAVVNEFYARGLRLVEVSKKHFALIPELMVRLSANPLKFILFIDDLSFETDNDDYNALKAVLEGSASARASNIAVYATSNRRHLVRESFSDRAGDDVHINETLQELSSLSERFGLSVGFHEPSQAEYLSIVHALARQFSIDMEPSALDAQALKFAYARSSRSPRAARQLMDSLLSGR